MATIGNNLVRIRGDREQQEIAERMQVKSTRLSNWENDRYKSVTVPTLLALAKGYQCSVEELLRGVDEGYDALVQELATKGDSIGDISVSDRASEHDKGPVTTGASIAEFGEHAAQIRLGAQPSGTIEELNQYRLGDFINFYEGLRLNRFNANAHQEEHRQIPGPARKKPTGGSTSS